MTPRDRSALLRMAGNIAAGLAGRVSYGPLNPEEREVIAEESVSVALLIHKDPRLDITEGEA